MAINVTENEDGTLTIEWDKEEDAIFNDWTAEDFINLISEYAEKVTAESEYADERRKEEYDINQTAEEVNQDIQTAKDFIRNQSTEQSQSGTVPPPPNFPLFP